MSVPMRPSIVFAILINHVNAGSMYHGDPLHNLTELHTTYQHTTELHTSRCADSVVCVTYMGNPLHNLASQTAMSVGLTLAQRRDDSTEVGPTLSQPTSLSGCKLHPAEPAHHRAAGFCAARWCAAGYCVIRLGCVEATRVYRVRTAPFLCSLKSKHLWVLGRQQA